MDANIEVVRLDQSNIGDAFDLYKRILKGPLPIQSFKAKYDTSYAGISHCSHLTYAKGKPIGFYGILPCLAVKERKTFLIAEACDSIVRADFRGKGLYALMAERSYDILKAAGCQFVFALNSLETYYATKKMGWGASDRFLFYFRIPVHTTRLKYYLAKAGGGAKRNRLFESVFGKYIVSRANYTNALNKEGTSLHYDQAFLEYKTYSKNYVIEIRNVAFWVKPRYFLDVGSVLYTSHAELDEALNILIERARKINLKEIIINASFGTDLYTYLIKRFTPNPSWVLGYKNISAGYDGAELLSCSADLDTF